MASAALLVLAALASAGHCDNGAGLAQFDERQPRLVVASRWQSEAFLPCRILNLDSEEQTVSWIRKRDSLVLSIDKMKLIDDRRFQLAQSHQDWTLVLSQPTSSDAGFYECQVSSMEPKLSRLIELRIVEALSHIANLTALFVRPNEQLNVTCTIDSPQKTDFVYWYKNGEAIQFNSLKHRPSSRARADSSPNSNELSELNGAEQAQDVGKLVRSTSSLIIKQTKLNDTANYTCLVSTAIRCQLKLITITATD